MSYSYIERRRIHRRAKAKLGLKSYAQGREDFMQQCIDNMVSEGSDPDDAEMICQLLWDEEGDVGEWDY